MFLPVCALLYPADVSILFFTFLGAVTYPSFFPSNNKIQIIRLTKCQALLYVTLLREKFLKSPLFSATFVFISNKSQKRHVFLRDNLVENKFTLKPVSGQISVVFTMRSAVLTSFKHNTRILSPYGEHVREHGSALAYI